MGLLSKIFRKKDRQAQPRTGRRATAGVGGQSFPLGSSFDKPQRLSWFENNDDGGLNEMLESLTWYSEHWGEGDHDVIGGTRGGMSWYLDPGKQFFIVNMDECWASEGMPLDPVIYSNWKGRNVEIFLESVSREKDVTWSVTQV